MRAAALYYQTTEIIGDGTVESLLRNGPRAEVAAVIQSLLRTSSADA